MGSLFVLPRIRGGTINLHKNEPVRIILLLNDIKTNVICEVLYVSLRGVYGG